MAASSAGNWICCVVLQVINNQSNIFIFCAALFILYTHIVASCEKQDSKQTAELLKMTQELGYYTLSPQAIIM